MLKIDMLKSIYLRKTINYVKLLLSLFNLALAELSLTMLVFVHLFSRA